MPIFEFRCMDCGEVFEKLFMSSDEKWEMACPQCKSQSLERVVSTTNYAIGVGPVHVASEYQGLDHGRAKIVSGLITCIDSAA